MQLNKKLSELIKKIMTQTTSLIFGGRTTISHKQCSAREIFQTKMRLRESELRTYSPKSDAYDTSKQVEIVILGAKKQATNLHVHEGKR